MYRKMILLAIVFLVIASALVGGAYVYMQSRAEPPSARLIGRWEGRGSQRAHLDVTVQPGAKGPGGTDSAKTVLTSSAVVEFRADGTYTWQETLKGVGLTFRVFYPKEEGEAPPRWEILQSRSDRMTVRLHLGEVEFNFHGPDEFTVDYSPSANIDATLTFNRIP